MIQKEFGRVVKSTLALANKTQNDLADELNMKRHQIQNIVSGRRRLDIEFVSGFYKKYGEYIGGESEKFILNLITYLSIKELTPDKFNDIMYKLRK